MKTETEKNIMLAHTAAHLLFRISRMPCFCNNDDVDICPACLAEAWFEKIYFKEDIGDSE